MKEDLELEEGGIVKANKFIFDKTKQYGMYAEIVLGNTCDPSAYYHIVGFKEWCNEAVEIAKKWLRKHRDTAIPVEYRDCVEWIVKAPIPESFSYYHLNGTVGWKYTPGNA